MKEGGGGAGRMVVQRPWRGGEGGQGCIRREESVTADVQGVGGWSGMY